METLINTTQHPDGAPHSSVTISDFSDEILLNILKYVPCLDLVLNVSGVCQKLRTLCQDKSLISHICLQKEYKAFDEEVKSLLKKLKGDLQTLDASGCYWMASSTLDHVIRCTGLVRLDISGWRMTSSRLSRILGALPLLRSLALDIGIGFDLQKLSAKGKAALARLSELKQTLLIASYGVVPCCGALQCLSLYLEVVEGWHEPSGYLQLMVGQSSVPRYNNLRWFSAYLAPGEVNCSLLNLYLAAFSLRVPESLNGLVFAIPGPVLQMPTAVREGMSMALLAGSAVTALQLPRTWLDSDTLKQVLARGCPTYLNMARCGVPGFEPLCVLLSANCNLSALRSLNLRGKGEDEIDAEGIMALTKRSPHLAHLNLSSTHYHHSTPEKNNEHLCAALGCFTKLRTLALPACALAGAPPCLADKPDIGKKLSSESLLRGLKKSRRVGVPTYHPVLEGSKDNQEQVSESCLRPLLNGCLYLVELELIGTGFSAMPRNEPVMRKDFACCPWARRVGDAELAALGKLRFLRRITLAHLPGVQNGTGIVELVQGCQELQALSLANIGYPRNVNYMQSVQEVLKHCPQLRDFRLEQMHFNANAAFFEALGHCSLLQRLCLVSRQGAFDHAAALSFMQLCERVVMFHMFTGGTLVACSSLQETLLYSFCASRPALHVVVYPLLHEDLGIVIREIPICHLEEITLFKSRVAEQPEAPDGS